MNWKPADQKIKRIKDMGSDLNPFLYNKSRIMDNYCSNP